VLKNYLSFDFITKLAREEKITLSQIFEPQSFERENKALANSDMLSTFLFGNVFLKSF
jgi:hypothetical protein